MKRGKVGRHHPGSRNRRNAKPKQCIVEKHYPNFAKYLLGGGRESEMPHVENFAIGLDDPFAAVDAVSSTTV